MIRRECFSFYRFSENYRAEGEAIYFKIAMRYKFDFIDEPLVVMRDHSANTGKNIKVMLADNIMIREELFKHPDFPEELKYLKNKLLAKIYFLKGWELIRLKKQYEDGLFNLKKAFKLRPVYVFNIRFLLGYIYSTLKNL